MLPHRWYAMSLRELGRRMRAEEFTSVDLTMGVLERLEGLGPELNAVVTRDARSRAGRGARADQEIAEEEVPRPAPRHPVRREGPARDARRARRPGAPRRTATQVFDDDATVVRRLREAGAVLVRQARDGRARGRHGLRPRRRVVHRARAQRRGTRSSGAAARSSGPGAAVAARARAVRDRLARRRARSSRRRLLRRDGAAAHVRAGRRGTARWRCRGRSTSSGRWRARPTTARSCSRRSRARTRGRRHVGRPRFDYPTRRRTREAAAPWRLAVPKGAIEKVQPEVRDELRGGARGARRARRGDARRRVARPAVGAGGGHDRRRRGRDRVPAT